jgi:hypothetical protein
MPRSTSKNATPTIINFPLDMKVKIVDQARKRNCSISEVVRTAVDKHAIEDNVKKAVENAVKKIKGETVKDGEMVACGAYGPLFWWAVDQLCPGSSTIHERKKRKYQTWLKQPCDMTNEELAREYTERGDFKGMAKLFAGITSDRKAVNHAD